MSSSNTTPARASDSLPARFARVAAGSSAANSRGRMIRNPSAPLMARPRYNRPVVRAVRICAGMATPLGVSGSGAAGRRPPYRVRYLTMSGKHKCERHRVQAQASRTPLSRERVIAAAVAVADAEGLQALTMRRLAADLGVEAMSLY